MGLVAKKNIEDLLFRRDVLHDTPQEGDIQVHDQRFFDRVLIEGSLGLGESYVEGWWDCERIDIFIAKLLSGSHEAQSLALWLQVMRNLEARVTNRARVRAYEVGARHYDLGNDFYAGMLGRSMSYSCAYWRAAANLDDAQEAKFDLVCRKLGLRPGQRILDIGCGWGSFARFAARRYGVAVDGITVSQQQALYARKLCAGLPVEIRYQDYHGIKGVYDHIVSIGMFEHVGYKNYRDYLRIVCDALAPSGLFLLQTIGAWRTYQAFDPWLEKYIFPNALVPSLRQIADALEGVFVLEDLHNFGRDYSHTLMAWYENFEELWARVQGQYGPRFYRMWRYYLLSCAGSFRARHNQLWQLVLSKNGVPDGYRSVR